MPWTISYKRSYRVYRSVSPPKPKKSPRLTELPRPEIQQTQRRSTSALSTTVPYITQALRDDRASLEELGTELPEVGRQVRHIRHVYDHGRDKVRRVGHMPLV